MFAFVVWLQSANLVFLPAIYAYFHQFAIVIKFHRNVLWEFEMKHLFPQSIQWKTFQFPQRILVKHAMNFN